MRQVPTYGVIGAGRMARHFIHYLKLLSIPSLQWTRACHDLTELKIFIQCCDPILILIKDDAIDTFISEHPRLNKKTLVHFSGSIATQQAIGAHPLMTFAHDLYTLEKYQTIPFIVDTQRLDFSQILPGLNNPHFIISPEMKNFYHSLCSMSGNFTTLLWQKMFKEMETQFHIPKEMIYPYLKQICHNLIADSENALTGPFIRNDKKTIANHQTALANDEYKLVYEGFFQMYFNKNQALEND